MGKKDRTGEVIQTKYGMAKIVQYNSCKDMTVLFDGYGLKEHVEYSALANNKVLPPGVKKKLRAPVHNKKDRTGEVVQTNYGPAKIIQYKTNWDMTVLFDSYGIKEHVSYVALVNNNVLPPGAKNKSERVRRTYEQAMLGKVFRTNRCGNCTVVEYKDSSHVTVKFEDGTLVDTTKGSLDSGGVDNPNHIRSKYIGAKFITDNGIPFTVTDVVKTKKGTNKRTKWIFTVKFIDGSQKKTVVSPTTITHGKITHPSFRRFRDKRNPYDERNIRTFLDYEVYGKAFATKTSVYYYCRKKGSLERTLDVLTPKEMIERSKPREQTG